MTFEEILQQVHSEGFRVLNLIEWPRGNGEFPNWRANLWKDAEGYTFADGATAVEALAAALAAAKGDTTPEAFISPPPRRSNQPTAAPNVANLSLLGLL